MRTWTNECYRLVLLLMSSHHHDITITINMPEDVTATLEELEKAPVVDVLDDASRAILRAVHQRNARDRLPIAGDGDSQTLAEKIERGSITSFTEEEREQLVAELMLARNKVTHIYELVKAYGSTPQIHFDRTSRQWSRTESISAKHALEYAVSPLSGQLVSGSEHAPMIYSGDPRKDVPSQLQAHLISNLKESDPKIVKGWLKAIAADTPEEVSLE
jgi:hypothetical protein